MSEDTNTTSSCANCGIAELDDVKLKNCTACDLVRYCSDACERGHKSEHENTCKNRVAELRDKLLFKQPESTHLGDCPICMMPLSLDLTKSSQYSCCFQLICNGCAVANTIREKEASMISSCPFCRKSIATKNDGEFEKRRMKRIEANDPVAIQVEGVEHYSKGDYSGAFEYYAKAAELGNAEAHCKLAAMYQLGRGVEKDEGKCLHHMEEAAIRGHPHARYVLGKNELSNGNPERAVKHWIIAAKQGEDKPIKMLMDAFKRGFVSKEVLATTLRAHQAAVDATKSPQRETAAELAANYERFVKERGYD